MYYTEKGTTTGTDTIFFFTCGMRIEEPISELISELLHQIQRFWGNMVLQEKGHMPVAARLQASLGCVRRKGGGGVMRQVLLRKPDKN